MYKFFLPYKLYCLVADVVPLSLKLLSYRGNVICLNCGNFTVVSLQLKHDEPVTVLSVLSLSHIHTSPADPGSPVSCPPWTVKRDVLVAHDSNSQKLCILELLSFEPLFILFHVGFRMPLFSYSRVRAWWVTQLLFDPCLSVISFSLILPSNT